MRRTAPISVAVTVPLAAALATFALVGVPGCGDRAGLRSDDAGSSSDEKSDGAGQTMSTAGDGSATPEDLGHAPPPADLAARPIADLAVRPVAADLSTRPPADAARAPDLATPVAADPCTAETGDGHYCGVNLPGTNADLDTLYHCVGDATADSVVCPNGCHPAPSGVPDYCEPAVTPPTVRGKGIWIWHFNTTAPSPVDAAKQAEAMGVGFVLIKSGEDTDVYTTDFSAANVAEFTSRGMEVYGWPYIRPGNHAATVDAIAQEAMVTGIKGLVLDVEVEWDQSGGTDFSSEATLLCQDIRKAVPGIFLGYTTFGWVAVHTDFPYAAFDGDCGDAFLPQTYYDYWTTGPTGGYHVGVDGAAMLGLKAPIWAAQDDENGASVADMNTFFDVAGPRASLWRWPDPGNPTNDDLPLLHWAN